MKLGYIGYGEAAYAMSCGVAELKLPDLVQAACSRTFSYKGKPEDAGVIRCSSYEEMAALCDTIFCMTPNTAAVPTARAMAPFFISFGNALKNDRITTRLYALSICGITRTQKLFLSPSFTIWR